MKLAFIAQLLPAVILGGCGANSTDQASTASDSPAIHLQADLSDLNLDRDLHVGSNFGGSVTINGQPGSGDITVFISTCPPNAFCIWGGPSYTAKFLGKRIGSCGIVTYRGLTDDRPVDGALTIITVRDFGRTTCDQTFPFDTEVSLITRAYDRMNRREIRTYSTLKGRSLLQ